MDEDKRIEVLKGAMLLELKGKAFYESIAQQAGNPDVRQIFEIMAREEGDHYKILTTTYQRLLKEGAFQAAGLDSSPSDLWKRILTDNLRSQIAAAGFEAAAISAALALEDQAARFYAQSVDKSEDDSEKNLYRWLADWERTHLDFLTRLDQELREHIWFDQKFWPSL